MNTDLPLFVRDFVNSCPKVGGGVNNWLFRCARILHPHRSPSDIEAILEAASADCGGDVSPDDIARAVKNSHPYSWQPGRINSGEGASRKRPEVNLREIEAIATTGISLPDLWESSPVRFPDGEAHTEEIVDLLFPNNPLVCVGKSNSVFNTRPRDQWRGELSEMQFIVPSPMIAKTGRTQEGKESAHTLENTGPRRFLVVECDFAVHAKDGTTETLFAPMIRRLQSSNRNTHDMGAAILGHLAERAPLALAVHSGGKSLHGWFWCCGQSEERLHKFMRYACTVGADRATWTRSQFVRMPDGRRDNDKPQNVMFFNPAVLP